MARLAVLVCILIFLVSVTASVVDRNLRSGPFLTQKLLQRSLDSLQNLKKAVPHQQMSRSTCKNINHMCYHDDECCDPFTCLADYAGAQGVCW